MTPANGRPRRPSGSPGTDALQPFRGSFSSGIRFASGHSFWLFRFGSTPTRFGAYDGVWAITPEGDWVLYADPPAVERVASTYHAFDRTVGASITWSRMDRDRVELRLRGDDGTTVELGARLGDSIGSRLLSALCALAPAWLLRTRVGAAVSNAGLSRIIEANGLKAVGLTDTDEPYRFEPERLRAVESAEGAVNDVDLGDPRPPDRPTAFGDVVAPSDPLFATGSLFLRPPPTRTTGPTTRTPGSEAAAASPSPRPR